MATACGAAAPTAAPPIEGHASGPAAVAPTTPAPSIKWIDNGFDVTGLPAVTRDGTRVVFARHDSDGGRGNPNLRIVEVGRTDAIVEAIIVLRVDEVDDLFTSDGHHPKLDARMSAANTWLAKLHHEADLVALSHLPGLPAPADGTSRDLRVDWQHDHLRLLRGATVVHERETPATWRAEDHAMCGGCAEICHNPASVGEAYVDDVRRIALLVIRYEGTDTCWEPPDQLHVVSW